MEKNTRDELIKVGAYIESKNGVEFSVRISKIEGSNVTVSWRNDYYEENSQVIPKSIIKVDGDFCIFYSSKQIEKANKELIENLKKLLNDEEFNFLIDDKNRTKYLRKFNDIIKTEMSITEDKYIAILADFRDTIKVDFQEKLRLDEIRKQIL